MTKREILLKISEAYPETDEPYELLKRLDDSGESFANDAAAKANEIRFSKLCRDALEQGVFSDDFQQIIGQYVPSSWGGARSGAGRPSTGRKKYQFYITDEEAEEVKKFINTLRMPSK